MSVYFINRYLYQLILIFLLAVILTSSAVAENAVRTIRVSSTLDFNAILITEVDVIFIYDEDLAGTLSTVKGDWYREKYSLLEKAEIAMEVITISVPQGFSYETVSLPERHSSAVKILVTAKHEAQNSSLYDITQRTNTLIEIYEYGITISGQ